MPQSERSQTIKDMLKWLYAKTKKDGGAKLNEILHHVTLEITEMGATERTVKKYLDVCQQMGLVSLSLDRLRFMTTRKCKNWLDRKVS